MKVAGKYAYTTSLDETIRIWDIEVTHRGVTTNSQTGDVVRVMRGHEAQIFNSILAYDKLITSSWDKTVRVWNVHVSDRYISSHIRMANVNWFSEDIPQKYMLCRCIMAVCTLVMWRATVLYGRSGYRGQCF